MLTKKLSIAIVFVLLLTGIVTTVAAAAPTRTGISDGWKEISVSPPGTIYNGAHESESDLTENTIQVSGKLRVAGSLVDTCSDNNTNDNGAGCNTDKSYGPFWYSARVESHHYFSTPGYKNSSFDTSMNY
jgi:hypothetical protein